MSLTHLDFPELAAALAKADGWRSEVLALHDERAVALALIACSQLMLPYWESHYRGDDKMERVVAAMKHWALKADRESQQRVRDALQRVAVEIKPYSYLSPAWPEPRGYDFPGDYAGDSIIAAGNAVLERGGPDFRDRAEACLDLAAEAVSQVIGHRQPDDELTKLWPAALERIRRGLIEQLGGMSPGAT